jgi:alkanesulfonate monooxygenase SsuD/methylene tetrahydromethanopterin reductase-like flavin-dependent oxidoreductase (luciferase family)
VKLGIGLPTYHGNLVRASDVLDWARLADDAGSTRWPSTTSPPTTPGAARSARRRRAVTRRIRLLTGALILPLQDEALVAKQAAVIDQVSGGRPISGYRSASGRTTSS